MAEPPRPEGASKTEEVYEWALIDGNMIKITSKNANGRICSHCGCHCPCKCECCKKGCCSKSEVTA